MSIVATRIKKETGRTVFFRDTIRSESIWGLVYTQVEYILTIITAQGSELMNMPPFPKKAMCIMLPIHVYRKLC